MPRKIWQQASPNDEDIASQGDAAAASYYSSSGDLILLSRLFQSARRLQLLPHILWSSAPGMF